jgi:hypothetical protein
MCGIQTFGVGNCGLFNCTEMADRKYTKKSSKSIISDINVQL